MEAKNIRLFMVLVGCTPKGRLTEQHDIYFGIGTDIQSLIPQIYNFWPDGGTLHIDAWREVTNVNNHRIDVVARNDNSLTPSLFFLNLGGYRPGEFEEYHYKMLTVADSAGLAVKKAKQTAFYKHFGFKGAESHIDEKYGLDVDDMYKVEDVLPQFLKDKYSLQITEDEGKHEDDLHIGYLKIKKP